MTIERIKRPIPSNLPPARIYFDDLQEIVRVFHEAAPQSELDEPMKTKFTVGDRTCDQVEELLDLGRETVKDFAVEFSTGSRYFARFGTSWSSTTWYTIGLSYEEQWVIFHRLEDILTPRKSLWRAIVHKIILSGSIWTFLTLLSLILLWGIVNTLIPGSISHWHYAGVLTYVAVGILIALGVAVAAGISVHSVVVLSRSSEGADARRASVYKAVPEIIRLVASFGLGLLTLYLKHKYWP